MALFGVFDFFLQLVILDLWKVVVKTIYCNICVGKSADWTALSAQRHRPAASDAAFRLVFGFDFDFSRRLRLGQ